MQISPERHLTTRNGLAFVRHPHDCAFKIAPNCVRRKFFKILEAIVPLQMHLEFTQVDDTALRIQADSVKNTTSVEGVIFRECDVHDLGCLEKFENLKFLEFFGGILNTVSKLASVPQHLEHVRFSQVKIRDVTAL